MQMSGKGSEILVGKGDLEQINIMAIRKVVTQISKENNFSHN